jgi:hypothetical protein
VEHERAGVRVLGGQLAHQPALARAGLPADERDAASVAGGARQQPAQRLELGRATDERKRRRQAQRAGQQVQRDGQI